MQANAHFAHSATEAHSLHSRSVAQEDLQPSDLSQKRTAEACPVTAPWTQDRRGHGSCTSTPCLTPDHGASMTFDLDLIRKYNVPGPRYTSYPTAPHFRDDLSFELIDEAIARNNFTTRPLSLYFHLPFCRSLCWYCGCTTVIGTGRGRVGPYLSALDEEMARKSSHIHPHRQVVQVHFGGGTPTFLSPDEIRWLMERIRHHFTISDDAEISVEIDPRRLTRDHIRALAQSGFNRASLGVQDNDPKVQEAIHRIQPFSLVEETTSWLREEGFSSINFDLIYGLPHQTVASFDRTLDQVLSLSPDRFAIYTYAHVPWIKPAQRLLEGSALPDPETKLAMQAHIVERLTANQYRFIGMDHYAREGNELTRAFDEGSLRRNFQGYSTFAGVDICGFGMSSISEIDDLYLQNPRDLLEYQQAVTTRDFPAYRAFLLSDDDKIRRHWIMALMCRGRISFDAFSDELGVDVPTYFQKEFARLGDLVDDGLIELDELGLSVTDLGRLLLRNICMPFDAYLEPDPERYSRAI
jgi:oxygen-independent coproporphyrinogen III oxidase